MKASCIEDEFILRETRKSKGRREALELQLGDLHARKQRMEELQAARGLAEELCERVRQRLGRLDYDEKRLLLAALGAKIVVHPERTYVHGNIPSYAMIGATSGNQRGRPGWRR